MNEINKLNEIIWVFEISKHQTLNQIAAIKLRAEEEGRELTIDELLLMEALNKRREEDEQIQLKTFHKLQEMKALQALAQKRKFSLRKRLLAAALILLVLLPSTWFILSHHFLKKEPLVEKPKSQSSPLEFRKAPKTTLPNHLPAPTMKRFPNPNTGIEAQKTFEYQAVNYQSRDVQRKDVRILDQKNRISIWSREQDTLRFQIVDRHRNKVYEEKLSYLNPLVIDKQEFRSEDEYYYFIYSDKEYKLVFQSKL